MANPTVTIAGTDRTGYSKVGSCRISKQLNGRATLDLILEDLRSGYMPALGNSIVVTKDGVTRFAGQISDLRSKVHPGTTAKQITARALDYTHILDRRLVSSTFENQTLYAIVKSIIDNCFAGEGITYTNVENPGPTITQKLVFNGCTGTAAFNQLSNITGYQFYIDAAKDLHFSAFASNSAPFGLTDTSKNWRDLEVSTSLNGYRNRQYVRTEHEINVTRSETWTADGVKNVFWAKYPFAARPTLLVNDTLTDLGLMADPDDMHLFTWYYMGPPGSFVYKVNPVTMDVIAPDEGTEIEIRYQALFSNIAMVEDTTEQAARASAEGGSGIWEAIREERNLDTLEALEAVGDGELRRNGKIPVKIGFRTDVDGLEPGQQIPIQNTLHDLNDDYLIESVDYEWIASIRGDFFRCSVKCSNSEPDTTGTGSGVAAMASYLGRVSEVARVGSTNSTAATSVHSATFVLGEARGRAGVEDVFVGTDILNPVETLTGTPFRVRARIKEAPVGADLIFDIKKVGSPVASIFNAPIRIADGDTSVVSTDIASGTEFNFDVLAIDVTQVGSTTPGKGLTIYVDYR